MPLVGPDGVSGIQGRARNFAAMKSPCATYSRSAILQSAMLTPNKPIQRTVQQRRPAPLLHGR